MDKRFRIDDKGFSLLELLVCLAISAFVIVAALSLVMVGTKNYDRTNKQTTLQQEMAFVTNLVGQNIREGVTEKTAISYFDSGAEIGDYEIHTGKKVLYYDKDKTSLYIYDETYALGSSYYRTGNPDNLISKYVVDFTAEWIQTGGNDKGAFDADYINKKIYKPDGNSYHSMGYSSLIKITVSVTVKNKTDNTEVIYQIRN